MRKLRIPESVNGHKGLRTRNWLNAPLLASMSPSNATTLFNGAYVADSYGFVLLRWPLVWLL